MGTWLTEASFFSMAVSEKGLTYNKVALIFQFSMDQPKDGWIFFESNLL